jgi:hypothetical protein
MKIIFHKNYANTLRIKKSDFLFEAIMHYIKYNNILIEDYESFKYDILDSVDGNKNITINVSEKYFDDSMGKIFPLINKSYKIIFSDFPIIISPGENTTILLTGDIQNLTKFCIMCSTSYSSYINEKYDVFKIKVDLYDSQWTWIGMKYNVNKNFKNTFIEKNLVNNIKKNIDDFLKRKTDDKFDGISNKITFLLYGPAGTGKTSLSMAISKEYKRHIYEISSSKLTTKNIETIFEGIKPNSVVLLDEADIIIKNIYSPKKETMSDLGSIIDREKQKTIELVNESAMLIQKNLFGSNDVYQQLLTILDGYSCLNDVILILTTNNEEFFQDEILFRPGRIDYKYKIDYPTRETICDMYKFYTNKELIPNKISDELLNIPMSTIINKYVNSGLIYEKEDLFY